MLDYIGQVCIFLALLIAIVFDIAKIITECRKQKRNYWKLCGYIIMLIFIAFLAFYSSLFKNVTINEEFSLDKGNISLIGKDENIHLHPSLAVEEPVSLKLKDTWQYLQYVTDYEILEGNIIKLHFICGENKQTNYDWAKRGFVLAYKIKMCIFKLKYIKYMLSNKKSLKQT